MTQPTDFDAITVADLRARGGIKWSMFPGTLGAFVAEMDFGCAPPVLSALHEAVDGQAFGYMPPPLTAAMAAACASWHQDRYGWSVPPSWVHPVADVIKALEVAIEHFSPPGRPVILPTPAYMPFLTFPRSMGREIIEVPMRTDGGRAELDLDGLDRAFAAGGGLLILCNPDNPVGRVFTTAELEQVSQVVERHGGRVFSDEIHAPLVYPGHRHVPYASLSPVTAGHTLTATSASKAWNLPGLKCAQVIVSNDADAQRWEQIGFMAEHGASTLGVIANTAAYTSGGPWLDDVLTYLDANRRLLADLVAEHLPGVGYTVPEGTYLGWLDCRPLGLPDSPAEFFRDQAAVVLTDGRACGEPGTGFARLNFATPAPVLTEIVVRMGAAVSARA